MFCVGYVEWIPFILDIFKFYKLEPEASDPIYSPTRYPAIGAAPTVAFIPSLEQTRFQSTVTELPLPAPYNQVFFSAIIVVYIIYGLV